MAAKKTIGEKARERNAKMAATPAKTKAGGDRIDKVIAAINKRLGGDGRVFRSADIQERAYLRRSSGVPSIDYITNGGFPKGGLIQFGGEFSTGKSRAALEACAEEQRTGKGAVVWVALEPFEKRRARECGFFIPFSEKLVVDIETGEEKPLDPFENASELELFRMAEAGIEDPYTEVSPFVLIEEQRGDVALDAALDCIKSNDFAYVVVDSLGVAKSSSWVTEKEVQDASDFSREAKMIGDYTTRALLALNIRYDENNQPAKDGERRNETTVLHLNHIVTVIGTQARSKHKTQAIKGGEGNKHNHHAIIFLWKGELLQDEKPGFTPYRYAQEVRCMCVKSKIGPPMLEGSYYYYMQPRGAFHEADIDKTKDLVGLALQAGVIERAGAWFSLDEGFRFQGRDAFEQGLRENPEWFNYLREMTRMAMRK